MARSPEYDRNIVVEQAMAVFWERGYGRTSIGDLVRATGLKPGSLYAAFGSKKGMFLEVLDEYNRAFLRRIEQMTGSDRPAVRELRSLLSDIAEETLAGDDHRGCLSVNALLEMAPHEPDVAERIEACNVRVRKRFTRLIDKAKSDGDIDEHADAEALSAFLVNNIWGMRVMCRGRPDAATLNSVVDAVMRTVENGTGPCRGHTSESAS